jgi:hypothetical protein
MAQVHFVSHLAGTQSKERKDGRWSPRATFWFAASGAALLWAAIAAVIIRLS